MTTLDQPTPDATTPNTHLGSARDFFAAIDPNIPPYIPELHEDDCEDVTCARCIVLTDDTQETAAVLLAVQAEQKAHPDLYDDYNVSATASSLYLVEHPEVRVSTEADYPGWKPGQR